MAGDRPGPDGSQRNSPRPFLIQYLTLMLIILSFMVGSFVTKVTQEAQRAPLLKTAQNQPPVPRPALHTFAIERVFAEDSAEVSADTIDAIRTLFMSHDLSAEVSVFADPGRSGFGALNQAVARAFAFKRALEVEGIPAEAIRVFGRGEPLGSQAEITIVPQKEHVVLAEGHLPVLSEDHLPEGRKAFSPSGESGRRPGGVS